MLTSMSVVTPIKRNCTVRLLPSVIEQETSFFQKIQILDKSFCCNEDKNESVCFSSTVRLILSAFTEGKYCFCQEARDVCAVAIGFPRAEGSAGAAGTRITGTVFAFP